MLFLVVLPYLYMVQESFHPRLPPMKRGGPEDFLTIQQYKSFFVEPTRAVHWNTHPHAGLLFLHPRHRCLLLFVNFAICYPLAYYMAQAGSVQKVRLLMLCAHRALLGERNPARLLVASAAGFQGPDQPDTYGASASSTRLLISSETNSGPLYRPVLRLSAHHGISALQRH